MQRVTALFGADSEGWLELLGCTTAPDVAAGVAQRLHNERPIKSPDPDLNDLIRSRARALARVAMGGER